MSDDLISPDRLARIRAALPAGAKFRAPPLEVTAGAYLAFAAREKAGTGRGMKADLRALHRSVSASADALGNLTPSVMGLIGIAWQINGPDLEDTQPIKRLQHLAGELRWLEQAIELATASLQRPFVD